MLFASFGLGRFANEGETDTIGTMKNELWNHKKAVLFDLDGVLFDTEYLAAKFMVEDGEAVGIHLPFDEILAMAGMAHRKFFYKVDKMLEDIGGFAEYERRTKDLPQRKLPFAEVKYPYVSEFLKFLKENGIKTAVCSSSPMDYINDALKEGEIEQYMDYRISGCDLPFSKPDPAIYLLAMETLGVQPEDCVVIEDSAFGIEAGKRAGCTVIAYHDEKYSYDHSEADRIISSYLELM